MPLTVTFAEMWVLAIALTLVAILISVWLASLTLKPVPASPPPQDRWMQPCPFCGSVSVVRERFSAVRGAMHYTASCDHVDCFFLGPERPDVHAAIAAWNRIEVAS